MTKHLHDARWVALFKNGWQPIDNQFKKNFEYFNESKLKVVYS
jgi:hypothetical protein